MALSTDKTHFFCQPGHHTPSCFIGAYFVSFNSKLTKRWAVCAVCGQEYEQRFDNLVLGGRHLDGTQQAEFEQNRFNWLKQAHVDGKAMTNDQISEFGILSTKYS